MTALDYVKGRENVVIRFYASNYPQGIDFSPEDTFPFDLEDVEGEIFPDDTFEASDLDHWRFNDWDGNTICAISLCVKKERL